MSCGAVSDGAVLLRAVIVFTYCRSNAVISYKLELRQAIWTIQKLKGNVQIHFGICFANKIPRPTRHRGVLSLGNAVQLFDMRQSASKPLMRFKTIGSYCTYNLIQEDNRNLFQEMELQFYAMSKSSTKNANQASDPKSISIFQCEVVMPKDWCPKMYLAAVFQSIKRNCVLAIPELEIEGHQLISLNKISWYFQQKQEEIHYKLLLNAAYLPVRGGEFM